LASILLIVQRTRYDQLDRASSEPHSLYKQMLAFAWPNAASGKKVSSVFASDKSFTIEQGWIKHFAAESVVVPQPSLRYRRVRKNRLGLQKTLSVGGVNKLCDSLTGLAIAKV
jgi:hypothetical protein